MKTRICLLILAVCLGPTLCLAAPEEAAVGAGGDASAKPTALAAMSSRRQAGPRGRPENNWRYRNENGRWWYWSTDNRWSYWNGSRWTPYSGRERGISPPRALAGQDGAAQGGGAVGPDGSATGEAPLGRAPFGRGMQGGQAGGLPLGATAGQDFGAWFNAYRGFQTGAGALRTAEQGGVEMGTADISAEATAAEVFEFGGIPGRQVRRPSPIGRTMKGSGAWFSSGSPFGIKHGYGSGFGYGGYGFDNPYGYGSRTGSGGAYGYGFGPF
ncbi:MAG TPA: hypothetical protein VFW87_24570, partial [Pirellulales bacterium]|nr:hypothetical protein [Pirellulales bacterium]